jgi:hypothetical protein
MYHCIHTGVSWIISKFHPNFRTMHVNDAPTKIKFKPSQLTTEHSEQP